MSYHGDFLSGDIVPIPFNTGTSSGASIDMSTDGSIVVYRLNTTTPVAVASSPHPSIVFTESVGGKLGPNLISIDTSNAIYTPGSYGVVVQDSVVSGQSVSGWTGTFSVQYRYTPGLLLRGYAQASDATHVGLPPTVNLADDILIGATVAVTYGVGFGQSRLAHALAGSADTLSIAPALATPLTSLSWIEVYASAPASTATGSISDDVAAAKTAALAAQAAAEGVATDAADAAAAAGTAATQATAAANNSSGVAAGVTNIQGRLPASLVSGRMAVSVEAINDDTDAAQSMAKTGASIARFTVGTGSTTQRIVTSDLTPNTSSVNQWKGRVVTFDRDTVTAGLRGQSRPISANSNADPPVLTVEALSTTPTSGDTGSIT
jgi:hypothetical protein